MHLSSLPQSQTPWSLLVRNAYQQLYQIYLTGSSYVDSGSVESHRLQQYGNAIITDAYPLLLLLSETVAESAEFESLPLEWIENIASKFSALLALIEEKWESAKEE